MMTLLSPMQDVIVNDTMMTLVANKFYKKSNIHDGRPIAIGRPIFDVVKWE